MKFGFLSKYFPSERFLKPAHIGVSFSDFNIKAISFDKNQTDPNLKSILLPIEKGSIVDGSIVNVEAVVKHLSSIREKFSSPFVFFTIPDELAYVFSTSISVASGSDATEGVAFVIEENVPLSLNDAVFDFVPTKISQADSKYQADFVVAAGVKKEVEKYVEAFRRSGFEPVGCIHESQAIAYAIVPQKSQGTFGVVHVRENRIGIYLVKENLVKFATLRSVLEGDYEKQFLDEYQKFLEYCLKYDLNQDQSIKSVLVCGEFEYAKKAVETIIESETPIKDIKLSNVWTNLFKIDKHLPDVSYEKSLSFAGSIGAALSDIV